MASVKSMARELLSVPNRRTASAADLSLAQMGRVPTSLLRKANVGERSAGWQMRELNRSMTIDQLRLAENFDRKTELLLDEAELALKKRGGGLPPTRRTATSEEKALAGRIKKWHRAVVEAMDGYAPRDTEYKSLRLEKDFLETAHRALGGGEIG